jgi:hypothetical protein
MNPSLKGHIRKLLSIPVPSRKTVLLIIVVATATVALNALVVTLLERYQNLHIPSTGNIYALGFDAYGGNITTEDGKQYIDWGTTYVGSQTNRSFYLRSKSNIDTTANLTTANWTYTNTQGQDVASPTTSYLNLTWDYDDSTVKPNQEIYVTLTLSVPYDADFVEYLITNKVTRFSFDIHIYPSKL